MKQQVIYKIVLVTLSLSLITGCIQLYDAVLENATGRKIEVVLPHQWTSSTQQGRRFEFCLSPGDSYTVKSISALGGLLGTIEVKDSTSGKLLYRKSLDYDFYKPYQDQKNFPFLNEDYIFRPFFRNPYLKYIITENTISLERKH